MGDACMNDRYVILTGGKNNAGDFLIKYRAKHLLASLRPDREIVDYDAWKPLDEEQLGVINSSRALILTGGPALQPRMYPDIYPLVDDLDRINVPILTMAIGWKGRNGTWEESYNYQLSSRTIQLLERIESSGHLSSVRDYHTLSVLRAHGLKNFLVTGCAALYSMDHIGKPLSFQESPSRVTFSLGVSFFKNKSVSEVNKQLILALRDTFPSSEFTVAFHHSTDPEVYRNTHNPNHSLLEAQLSLIDWLKDRDIGWIDISGSAEAMLEHYMACDLHIGYRVHAHILMASIGRPTVLIAEDGRGMALREVLGGMVFDGCFKPFPGLVGKVAKRLGWLGASFMASTSLASDLPMQVTSDMESGFPRISQQKGSVERHFQIMLRFVEGLP